jgi:multicomponent Na+:H+ antiporter subunit G
MTRVSREGTCPVIDDILNVAAAVFVVLGAALSLVAGVGVLRFPDALSRLHAGTKPQVLGLACIVIAIALSARSWTAVLLLIPVMLFQLVTQPVAAHMIGRAGYRTRNLRPDLLVVDELADDVERASARPDPGPDHPDPDEPDDEVSGDAPGDEGLTDDRTDARG